MTPRPFTSAEVACRLGYADIKNFLRAEPRLIAAGMPASIKPGRRAYERAGMEAWLTRNDPRRPKLQRAANDAIAPPQPNTDAQWAAFLHQHYGQPAE